MPRRLAQRACDRKHNHGNWRQIWIDCGGMCIAKINGKDEPCASHDSLEFHEVWGENHNNQTGKFMHRILLCNHCHSLIGGHHAKFIKFQSHPSMLHDDVMIEQDKCGGYKNWVALYELDDSRFGIYLYDGPQVEDEEYANAAT